MSNVWFTRKHKETAGTKRKKWCQRWSYRGSAHGPEMTGYSITPESSISGNWMDFILIYALSFSIAHRLNLCLGFHPLPSPAIIHFTLIIMIGILNPERVWCTGVKRGEKKAWKFIIILFLYLLSLMLFSRFLVLLFFIKLWHKFCQNFGKVWISAPPSATLMKIYWGGGVKGPLLIEHR